MRFWAATSVDELAGVLARHAGPNMPPRIDSARREITVTHAGWTLRVLWDHGQAGWLYAIEDDGACWTVDSGPIDTAADLADSYRRLVTKSLVAAPCGVELMVVASSRRRRQSDRRRPGSRRLR
jgi:hypothetical protein